MNYRFAVLTAVCVLAASSVVAQTRARSINDMFRDADLVFVGDTESTTSAWNASRTMIFTTVQERVVGSLAFKGVSPGQSVSWQQPGGQVGNIKTIVYDGPLFLRGDRSLLFLVAPARVFVYPTIGGALGKIDVQTVGQERQVIILWREQGQFYPMPLSPRSEQVTVPLNQLGAIFGSEVKP